MGHYQDWIHQSQIEPDYEFIIGYQVPPYLGGKDELHNLEKIDMEVYWEL
ncbi:hypothetical protein LNTAR_24813 [Lentisphaera araneosa HTCC2155]|uniref:T6SS immunity protein Tdi1 C-terminal domain-containing protein n=1 Tax=Lentisphaera araneosa HTCC2155 TaxID=313628 RepID=A6DSX0_9BACT|nr:hypothetical protein LNTAR_24813 [Lentisphaera araneosa HTCC2155]